MPRALLKTMTYSLMHLSVAVTVAFVLTRDWRIALGIGLIEPMVQTVAYTIHERVWERFGCRARPVQSVHACGDTLEAIRGHLADAAPEGSGRHPLIGAGA